MSEICELLEDTFTDSSDDEEYVPASVSDVESEEGSEGGEGGEGGGSGDEDETPDGDGVTTTQSNDVGESVVYTSGVK